MLVAAGGQLDTWQEGEMEHMGESWVGGYGGRKSQIHHIGFSWPELSTSPIRRAGDSAISGQLG